MKNKIAIGVDVGGSHVSSTAYNIETKQLLDHTHAENDLNNHGHADEVIDAWGKTIK